MRTHPLRSLIGSSATLFAAAAVLGAARDGSPPVWDNPISRPRWLPGVTRDTVLPQDTYFFSIGERGERILATFGVRLR